MFFVYFFSIFLSGLGTLAGLIVLIVGLSGSKAKTRNIIRKGNYKKGKD
jgi:hypothetical protein